MTITLPSIAALSDGDLIARVRDAARNERHATATLIALLMEVDSRRVHLAEGCSSLFTYCTQVLHLSEHAAYGRIAAARATRKFPSILTQLESGALTLTSMCLLAPHLTEANHVAVLDAASHKSKREVEQLVARLSPKPDVPAVVRKLPPMRDTAPLNVPPPADFLLPVEPSPLAPSASHAKPLTSADRLPAQAQSAASRAVMGPLSRERFKLQLTIGRATHDKLRRLQDLLRHSVPYGDLEAIFDRALTLLLEHAERTKLAAARAPRARACHGTGATRYIPAPVKREVWARDGGQCAFRGRRGRCQETGFLEFHHVVPFAAGGKSTVENLELRCRSHNAYESDQWFGTVREPPDSAVNSSTAHEKS